MPVSSRGHYGFKSFQIVDWFCLFIYLWVLTFPLEDCWEFGNFVIILIHHNINFGNMTGSTSGVGIVNPSKAH
jgi:hypothetical protein